MKKELLLLLFLLLKNILLSQVGIRDCRAMPPFVQKLGFDIKKSAFSTSERRYTGLCYVEIHENGENKVYQHSSWVKAGNLSAIAITEKGEIFCVPTPIVNVLKNKPSEQNYLYKVDPISGEMKKTLELPILAKANANNPFGLIGLAYDCDSKVLYASSIMGSSMEQEKGAVYAIRLSDLKIIGTLIDNDIMGLGVIMKNNEKRLMVGRTRDGKIQSVLLNKDGTFKGNIENEMTLEGLGERGDDVARKIRMSADGTLIITGVSFYYNLTAPHEKPESKYIFKYSAQEARWILLEIQ